MKISSESISYLLVSLNTVEMIRRTVSEGELYADYYVTGIWMSGERATTHLYLHKAKSGGEIALGDRVSIEEAIKLLEGGKIIRTKRWSYIRAEWVTGVPLKLVTLPGGSRCIKSGSGNVVTDNLEHLILMHPII